MQCGGGSDGGGGGNLNWGRVFSLFVRVADYPSRCRLRGVCDRFYSPSRSVADITRMEQFCQRSPVGHQQHPCLTDNSLAATHTHRQTETTHTRRFQSQPTSLSQLTGGPSLSLIPKESYFYPSNSGSLPHTRKYAGPCRAEPRV